MPTYRLIETLARQLEAQVNLTKITSRNKWKLRDIMMLENFIILSFILGTYLMLCCILEYITAILRKERKKKEHTHKLYIIIKMSNRYVVEYEGPGLQCPRDVENENRGSKGRRNLLIKQKISEIQS